MASSTLQVPMQVVTTDGSTGFKVISHAPKIVVGTKVIESGISSGYFTVNWTSLGGTASKKYMVLTTPGNMPNGSPVNMTYVYDESTATKAKFYVSGIGSATGGFRFSYLFIDEYHA